MGYAAGLQSQWGYKAESVYGTEVVVDRFQEFTAESINAKINRIPSRGIRAGRSVFHRRLSGTQIVEGNVDFEVAPQGAALLWTHALGTVATAGTVAPYTHTITPHAQWDTLSMTMQFNRPDITGADRAFTYTGCQIMDWDIQCEVNQIVKGTFGIRAQDEEMDTALASASYPSGLSPFVFSHGAVTIGGTAYDVKRIQLNGDNRGDRGHRISATNPTFARQSKVADWRMFTGSLVADLSNPTTGPYADYIANTERALVLTFNAGSSATMTITTNVQFDGDTPNVRGPGLLDQNLTFTCVSSSSDAAAITVAIANADSAA